MCGNLHKRLSRYNKGMNRPEWQLLIWLRTETSCNKPLEIPILIPSSISPVEDNTDMNLTGPGILECRDPVPDIRVTTGIVLMVSDSNYHPSFYLTVFIVDVLKLYICRPRKSCTCLTSDKLQYGLKIGILMKMSSWLEKLPNILIIIASLAKRFPSFRRKLLITSILNTALATGHKEYGQKSI